MNFLDFITRPPNFYEQAKINAIRGGGSPSPVPSDYDLLEYLQSDGTAFIKLPWKIDGGNTATGIRNLNDGFKIKFALSGDQQAAFGDRWGYFLKSENGYMWARMMNDSSSNVLNTNISFTTSPQEWEFNNGKLYFENTLIHDFWNPVYIGTGGAGIHYLFGRNTGSLTSSGNNGHIKIYYMKHTVDIPSTTYPDIPFELYPVRRKADGVLGMYDIINDVFYTNSGGGSFIAPA